MAPPLPPKLTIAAAGGPNEAHGPGRTDGNYQKLSGLFLLLSTELQGKYLMFDMMNFKYTQYHLVRFT
jgi:hypothetical protein